MIEAVNSVVVNAPSLRAAAEAVSVSRTAADIAPVVQLGENSVVEIPKAPFISPYIVIDRNYNKAVLQIRDSDTGDVVQQFPTESRLAQISRVQVKAQHAAEMSAVPDQRPSSVAKQVVAPEYQAPVPPRSDITTVQEVTSTPPSNAPSQAIAAFSAGAQTAQAAQVSSVSVLA